MLIQPWDRPGDEAEWRAFLASQRFGHLVAAGRDRDVPVVVPTVFLVDGDDVVLHLARTNPVWAAIGENPAVLLSVAGDWAVVPGPWKAIGDEDPMVGIPTLYYAAVQVVGAARVVDDPDGLAALLRLQVDDVHEPGDLVDPAEHGGRLGAIRGLRLPMTDVRAKLKYGGNVDAEHREAVARRLDDRGGPGDAAAARWARSRPSR